MAAELHRHEDDLTWRKFNHFLTLHGILLSALGVIWSGTTAVRPNLRAASIAISLFGMFASSVWSLIQKRGQLYHTYRIFQARAAEQALKVDGVQVLNLFEKGLNEQELVNVSKIYKFPTQTLIFGLGLIVSAVWLGLLVYFSFFIG